MPFSGSVWKGDNNNDDHAKITLYRYSICAKASRPPFRISLPARALLERERNVIPQQPHSLSLSLGPPWFQKRLRVKRFYLPPEGRATSTHTHRSEYKERERESAGSALPVATARSLLSSSTNYVYSTNPLLQSITYIARLYIYI